jgi:hypothetical protein|tara:strand:- start:2370 stop:2606 length:237 start_codon:yes stop_codon:yes gene_type:complete
MERILKVYNDETGTLVAFTKALLYLYNKHEYMFETRDREQELKELIKKEFNATFINDTWPKLVFNTEQQKTLFLIKFN